MILPDANLLLYAYDASSPFHQTSATWWSKTLDGSEIVGISSPVLFAFVRLSTSVARLAVLSPCTFPQCPLV